MYDENNTYEGTPFQKSLTAVLGSDMHNGADFRSRLFSLPSFALGTLLSVGSFRCMYYLRQRSQAIFGVGYLAAFIGSGTLIWDRAGNMGYDYATAASLWTWVEFKLWTNRVTNIPGAPSFRSYHLLPMTTLGNLGLASALYRALSLDGVLATAMRQRPVKDQLVSRWGPRHKPNLGDD